MENAGQVVKTFYEAAVKRDFPAARDCLADNMLFEGLFETYRDADEYMKTFAGLLHITERLEVKKIISEGNDAAIFFELETRAPAEATVLVAEWHQVRNGKIFHARSAFDGRPYAALFAGAARSRSA
jgi:ketosteroid isomerase-like protein